MAWRVYAVVACTWFLLSFVAHCQTCGNSECQDASDEAAKVGHALLQKQTKTHAVTSGEDTQPAGNVESQFSCRLVPGPNYHNSACLVGMPDGSSLTGRCQQWGVYDVNQGRCQVDRGTVDAFSVCGIGSDGKPCTWAGFKGLCKQNLANQGLMCDIWTNYKPKPSKCHEECKSPTCKAGAGWNGGFPLQRDGYCGQTCSRAFTGGIRYCGEGDSYIKGSSIDCSGCRKTCPEDCKSASCFAGGSHNGGVPLVGGSCQNICSRAWAGKRYCGTGNAYMQSDSLDCAACAQEGGAPQTCSDKCKSPTCVDGGAHNGGVSLVKGKCTQHCSKDFHGRRFCGTGEAYTSGDSVDCTPCAKEEQGSQFYLAPDKVSFCPKIQQDGTSRRFSNHVENFDKCASITMIDGKAYTWSGSFGCHPYWPKAGCFVWGSALYFSTCQGPDLHSISQHEHYGVCEMAS